MKLSQEEYADDNGHKVKAETVQNVTTYYHFSDGFYEWYCASCHKVHSSRSCGWPIAGQVLHCEECGQTNLLLRSDVDFVNRGAQFACEYDGATSIIDEYKKRAERAEEYERELRRKIGFIVSCLGSELHNWVQDKFRALKEEVDKKSAA